ncbi:MAG: hypothetical protein ABSD43_16435 [Terracidiphilus sp.]
MTAPAPAPAVDLSFPHHWQAEILPARPLILPARRFVYPRQAEEVERGALELLIRPVAEAVDESSPKPPLDAPSSPFAREFLATCALGFLDPAVPSGIWSTPNPEEICAVSGGYAYLIDTSDPDRFTMLPYRPVLEVRPLPAQGLLLFLGHRSILGWGRDGQAWQAEKLSSEGVVIASIEGSVLHGLGWELSTGKEFPFALDLRTGQRIA